MKTKTPPKRRGRFSQYERFLNEICNEAKTKAHKRPRYLNGIGIFAGKQATKAWIKITLPKGGTFKGKYKRPGSSLEIPVGRLSGWTWQSLEVERDRLQGLANKGDPLEPERLILFSELAAEWCLTRRNAVKRYDTIQTHLNSRILPFFGRMAVSEIDLKDISKWQTSLLSERRPAYVKRVRTTLNSVLNYGVRLGYIAKNPVMLADRIRGIEPRSRSFSSSEIKLILETAATIDGIRNKSAQSNYLSGWLRQFIEWALHSGMRKGEITSLTFDKILELPNGSFVRVENTKSDKPRLVPCSQRMLEIIDEMKAFSRNAGDGRIFPISASTIKRDLIKLWAMCGLKDARLHDLRRTYTTTIVQHGLDVRTVAEILGHSDLSMIHKVYAQVELSPRAAEIIQGEYA